MGKLTAEELDRSLKLSVAYESERNRFVDGFGTDTSCDDREVRYLQPKHLAQGRMYLEFIDGKAYTWDGTNDATKLLIHNNYGRQRKRSATVEEVPYMLIFTTDGKMCIAPKIINILHHSSFTSGGDVRFACCVQIKEGTVTEIDDHSGHYTPALYNMVKLLQELKNQGANLSGTKIKINEWIHDCRKHVEAAEMHFANAEEFLNLYSAELEGEIFAAKTIADAVEEFNAAACYNEKDADRVYYIKARNELYRFRYNHALGGGDISFTSLYEEFNRNNRINSGRTYPLEEMDRNVSQPWMQSQDVHMCTSIPPDISMFTRTSRMCNMRSEKLPGSLVFSNSVRVLSFSSADGEVTNLPSSFDTATEIFPRPQQHAATLHTWQNNLCSWPSTPMLPSAGRQDRKCNRPTVGEVERSLFFSSNVLRPACSCPRRCDPPGRSFHRGG